MDSNQLILLDRLLEDKRSESEEAITESDFFETFSIEQVLKDFDLSHDEIADGIVDGGADGGIDGFYIFVNDVLIAEDTDLSQIGRTATINLYVFQTKISKGFTESAVDKLSHTVADIFDFSKSLPGMTHLYSPQILSKAELYKRVSFDLASRLPFLQTDFYYITRGSEPSSSQIARAERVKGAMTKLFPSCQSHFHFVGCSKLLDLSRKPLLENLSLTFSEGPLPTESGGVVGLVKLSEYHSFLSGNEGRIRNGLFEYNVRDYQGSTEVNSAIKSTLHSSDQGEFWWLNNGITIVCDRMNSASKTVTLEDPQIVNGLQTSSEIFQYFRSGSGEGESRSVLVRIIEPTDESSRDRIIKATNSQTVIQTASLRATDPFQRDLEEYFLMNDLFYDRRKNYYKNLGKPKARIISIQTLAQAYIAIVLGQPDNARARPSSLLKDDHRYQSVFSSDHSLESYLKSYRLFETVDRFLKSPDMMTATEERNNAKYHISMMVALSKIGKTSATPQLIADLDMTKISDTDILDCYNIWYSEEEMAHHKLNANNDQIAKSKDFVLFLKRRLKKEFNLSD